MTIFIIGSCETYENGGYETILVLDCPIVVTCSPLSAQEMADLQLVLSGKSNVVWDRIVLGGYFLPDSEIKPLNTDSTLRVATLSTSYACIFNTNIIHAIADMDYSSSRNTEYMSRVLSFQTQVFQRSTELLSEWKANMVYADNVTAYENRIHIVKGVVTLFVVIVLLILLYLLSVVFFAK